MFFSSFMEFLIIIQARTGSSRIPGKVLKKVNGTTLIEFTINRLKRKVPHLPITICTSDLKDDDAIEVLCLKHGLDCFRGDHLNVASRFYEISKAGQFDVFVRVCADSPMIDGELVKKLVDKWEPHLDLLTNKSPRTFPLGQSIELVNRKTYLDYYPKFKNQDDFEHVTHYFHQNLKDFSYLNLKNSSDQSKASLAIDEPSDFIKFKNFVTRYGERWIDLPFTKILEIYCEMPK
jgi:spore coat polysaccharide biosynthesis protein SpsF